MSDTIPTSHMPLLLALEVDVIKYLQIFPKMLWSFWEATDHSKRLNKVFQETIIRCDQTSLVFLLLKLVKIKGAIKPFEKNMKSQQIFKFLNFKAGYLVILSEINQSPTVA